MESARPAERTAEESSFGKSQLQRRGRKWRIYIYIYAGKDETTL
jgi:hypothetical protein